jgi:putative glycosyltransferase
MYYSSSYLQEFCTRVKNTVTRITDDYEIVLVNDGSPDNSLAVALSLQETDNHIIIVDLSRNFGHHNAIYTGLQHVSGDFIFLIDCDLEEEPELLQVFWDKYNEDKGADVVYGVQIKRKGGFFERISGKMFYKALNAMTSIEYPADTLTARLMKKTYVNAVLQHREKTMDIWSIFVLTGFQQTPVVVQKKYKGSTTYTFTKKVQRAVEIITSFSHRPLYFIFLVGIVWLVISLINIAIIVVKKIVWGIQIEGWASILASVWLIGGVIILILGIISIYLSKMFLELKGRPLSIVKSVYKKN